MPSVPVPSPPPSESDADGSHTRTVQVPGSRSTVNVNGPTSPFAPAMVLPRCTGSPPPAGTTSHARVPSKAVAVPLTVTVGPVRTAPDAGSSSVVVPFVARSSGNGVAGGDTGGVSSGDDVLADGDAPPPGSAQPASASAAPVASA